MEEKIRKCSGIIIYRYNAQDNDFEILLIKTKNFKDSAGEYLHTIVGGRIEEQDKGANNKGKSRSSAKRECLEEVCLGISEMVYIGITTAVGEEIGYKDPKMHFEFYHFVAKARENLNANKIIHANNEVIYAGFHKRQELFSLLMEPQLRKMIEDVYNHAETYFKK